MREVRTEEGKGKERERIMIEMK